MCIIYKRHLKLDTKNIKKCLYKYKDAKFVKK